MFLSLPDGPIVTINCISPFANICKVLHWKILAPVQEDSVQETSISESLSYYHSYVLKCQFLSHYYSYYSRLQIFLKVYSGIVRFKLYANVVELISIFMWGMPCKLTIYSIYSVYIYQLHMNKTVFLKWDQIEDIVVKKLSKTLSSPVLSSLKSSTHYSGY